MKMGIIWGNRSGNGKESKLNVNTARPARKSKGFTLVELIVVLVILAVLAAIAVPTLIAFIDKGKEKEIETAGQKALAATQTALSDIYADGSSRFSVAKRTATRKLAAVDNDKNNSDTSFTVWNEKKLWDGKTVAVAKNIGSYTVSKALYREGEKYAAYDGAEWTIFDSEEKAMASLNLSSTDEENVIYVWPYKQDFAYLDGSVPDDPDETDPTKKSSVKVVTFKLPAATLSHVFFSLDGRTSNSGKDSVKVVFWKDADGNISSYWDTTGTQHKFRVDDTHTYWVNIVNTASNSYDFLGWQPEGSDIVTVDKSILQNYVFASNQNQFTFAGVIESDEIITQVATLDKEKTKALIGAASVSSIRKVTGGVDDYKPEMMPSLGATRIDMQIPGEGGQVWGWISEGVLNWWTDASTVYLPEDCSNFFNSATKIADVSLDEFDASKITTMANMFAGNDALQSVTFGNNFHAGRLKNTSHMFDGCKNLSGLSDLEKFNAEEGSLTDTSYMFNGCEKLSSIAFGDGFDTAGVTSMKAMFQGCKAATNINVSNLVTPAVTDMSYIFNDCNAVTSLDIQKWNPGSVTTLDYAFSGCENLASLTTDTWNLTNCKYMNYTFKGCHRLNNDFSKISTSASLEQMEGVFFECSAASGIDVKSWDTSNVKQMKYVFKGCSNATKIDISRWNMNGVTTLEEAFSGCSRLTSLDVNLDGSNLWNLPECTSLKSAFQNCSSNTEFPKIKTDKLTDMMATYSGCSKLANVDLTAVKPAAITTMEATFNGCTNLAKVDLGTAWDLSACQNFNSTFAGCTSLNQDFREMKVNTAATDIQGMFKNCAALSKLNLRNWNTTHVSKCSSSFEGCVNLRRIYASDNCTLVQSTDNTDTFKNCTKIVGEKGTTYDSGNVDGDYGWIDGRENKEGYFSYRLAARMIASTEGWVYNNVKYSGNSITKINYLHFRRVTDSGLTEETVKAKNGCTDQLTDPTFLEGYPVYFWLEKNGTGYDVCWWSEADFLIINQGMQQMFYNWKSAELNLTDLDFTEVRDASEFFQNALKLKTIDLTLNNVTDVENMFSGCTSLSEVNLNINTASGVSGVTAKNMFYGDTVLESVTVNAKGDFASLEGMFSGCKKIADLSNINIDTTGATAGVTLKNMFYGCTGLTSAEMTSEELVNVTSLEGLFDGCTALENLAFYVETKSGSTDVSTANIFRNTGNLANVTLSGSGEGIVSTNGLFKNRTNLQTVDMSAFVLKGTADLDYMFYNSANLKSVKLNVDTSELTTGASMEYMFKDDKKLTEVSITGDGSNVSSAYQMFYGASAIKNVDLTDEGKFKFGKIHSMREMFRGCSELESVKLSVDTSDSETGCSFNNTFKDNIKLTDVTLSVEGGKVSTLESMFMGCEKLADLSNIEIDTSESDAGVSCLTMFSGCSALTEAVLDSVHGFNLKYITDMKSMFGNCANLENLSLHVETSDVAGSVSVETFVANDVKLETLTITGMGKGITSTKDMFKSNSTLTKLTTVDMIDFELNSITTLAGLFSPCPNLDSAKLKIDTSNSSNVSMYQMFYNCKKLKEVEIIGNWKNVSTLEEMFRYDTKLEKIDFGDEVDMSGLRTVKHIFDDITNATDADRIFNTFAESFAKWNLGENQIFEVKENRTYTNRISNKMVNNKGVFAGKTAYNNGKEYAVRDNKYLCHRE